MSRRKGAKNILPSKEVQRQLLRDVTRKALDGDVQAIGVVLNYTALLVDQLNSVKSRSRNNSTELEHG